MSESENKIELIRESFSHDESADPLCEAHRKEVGERLPSTRAIPTTSFTETECSPRRAAANEKGKPVSRATAIVDAHVLLVRDAHALLLKRRNTGFEDGKYCLIAGHLEPDESIVDAAAREALEEVGICIPTESLRFVHVIHNSSGGHRIGLFFSR